MMDRGLLLKEQSRLDMELSAIFPRAGKLVLEDGTTFEGKSFGYPGSRPAKSSSAPAWLAIPKRSPILLSPVRF